MTPVELHPVVKRFIEDGGALSQSLGLGRVVGQIYAFLYFSDVPCALGDLQRALRISKGGASMGVRQLEQWGAARKVWVPGDRKDYYEANDWFGRILKSVLMDTMAKKMADGTAFLDAAEAMLKPGDVKAAFIRERIAHMREFQGKAVKVWKNPLLQGLLK